LRRFNHRSPSDPNIVGSWTSVRSISARAPTQSQSAGRLGRRFRVIPLGILGKTLTLLGGYP
jgi:hypothetical protein